MMNVHERCDHEFMKDDEVLTLLIWVVLGFVFFTLIGIFSKI